MSKKTYAEKLKDPRWQRKRLVVLNRSDFTCEDCGAVDKTLHVHHCLYYPETEPWEYDNSQLRALCPECHEERAHNEKSIMYAIRLFMASLDKRELNQVASGIPEICGGELRDEAILWFQSLPDKASKE